MARPMRYCALLPPSYDAQPKRTYPVLYFLHGIFENEQTFIDAGAWNLVEHLRERGTIGEFIIVTPDGGSTFFINSRDGRRPWESFFTTEFIPQIEKRYRIAAARASRAVGGVSMGGYGALHLAFAHRQLFAAVAVHSPAIMKTLPPGLMSGGLASSRLAALTDTFGRPLDAAYWQTKNPLTLAAHAPLAGMKIYFDCGREDDYGFDSGAVALDKTLTARRIRHEFHLYPGGHGWVFVAQHLPASLEFVWKAFEKK
ncbi:MAG TPA: alpha/beta hydrolase-fold protein [Terriglobales bacterium]|nr:alpha/beta hydrolase-fold protein [Terriglobales bacterium]